MNSVKNSLAALALFCQLPSLSWAWNWDWLNPKPTGNSLIGLSLVDSMQTIAISENGEIAESEDAGETWTLRGAGIDSLAMSVAIRMDANTYLAAGDQGHIWKSKDQGQSWQVKEQGTEIYFDLCQMKGNIAIAVGTHGMVLRSEDKGETWRRVRVDSTGPNLVGVHCGENGFAFAVGEAGLLVKSRDSGKTWETLASPIESMLAGVAFIDSLRGFATGEDGVILDTKDGGQSWRKQVLDSFALLRNFRVDKSRITLTGSHGNIWRSTNLGETWTRIESGTDSYLGPSVQSGVGEELIVGNAGAIFKSKDAGKTWQNKRLGRVNELIGMTVLSPQDWVAFGMGATVLRTRDAGRTWKEWFNPNQPGLLAGGFWGTEKGLVTGYSGAILRTEDGGASWTRSESGKPNRWLDGVAWCDSLTAMVVGDSGLLLRSVDAGKSWSQLFGISGLTDQTLSAIQFVNSHTAFVVGYRGLILKTEDKGVTWKVLKAPTSENFYAVSFRNENSGMAVGHKGVIVFTEDAGISWSLKSSGEPDDELYGVAQLSADTAVIVGEWLHDPVVRVSVNGGKTWKSIPPASGAILNGVVPIGKGRFVAIGGGGALVQGDLDQAVNIQILKNSLYNSGCEFQIHRLSGTPMFQLDFNLPKDGAVSLAVYDLNGFRLKQVKIGSFQKGRYSRIVPLLLPHKPMIATLGLIKSGRKDLNLNVRVLR